MHNNITATYQYVITVAHFSLFPLTEFPYSRSYNSFTTAVQANLYSLSRTFYQLGNEHVITEGMRVSFSRIYNSDEQNHRNSTYTYSRRLEK